MINLLLVILNVRVHNAKLNLSFTTSKKFPDQGNVLNHYRFTHALTHSWVVSVRSTFTAYTYVSACFSSSACTSFLLIITPILWQKRSDAMKLSSFSVLADVGEPVLMCDGGAGRSPLIASFSVGPDELLLVGLELDAIAVHKMFFNGWRSDRRGDLHQHLLLPPFCFRKRFKEGLVRNLVFTLRYSPLARNCGRYFFKMAGEMQDIRSRTSRTSKILTSLLASGKLKILNLWSWSYLNVFVCASIHLTTLLTLCAAC